MKRNRKLSKSQVCTIRHKYLYEGVTSTELAKKYGLTPSTIRRIARGALYSDIPMPKRISVSSSFRNYIAYPDNRIWSLSSKKFIKAGDKGRASNVKYYDLKDGEYRITIRKSDVSKQFFR